MWLSSSQPTCSYCAVTNPTHLSPPVVRSDRALVITAGAGELKRTVGPGAWVVLEELVLLSDCETGQRVAPASTRALAHSLGLDKDTVGRALHRLTQHHLIEAMQSRDAAGHFGRATYRIFVSPDVLATSVTKATSRTQPAQQRDHAQLTFAIGS